MANGSTCTGTERPTCRRSSSRNNDPQDNTRQKSNINTHDMSSETSSAGFDASNLAPSHLEQGLDLSGNPCERNEEPSSEAVADAPPAEDYRCLLGYFFYRTTHTQAFGMRSTEKRIITNENWAHSFSRISYYAYTAVSTTGFALVETVKNFFLGLSLFVQVIPIAGTLGAGPLAMYVLFSVCGVLAGICYPWTSENKGSPTRRSTTPRTEHADHSVTKYYYKMLGVHETASMREIKKAYFKMSRKYHPDRNSDDGNRMAVINAAHDTLSDLQKRQHYDSQQDSQQDTADALHFEMFYAAFLGTSFFVQFIGPCHFPAVLNVVQDSTTPEARLAACVEHLSYILDRYENCSDYEAFLANEVDILLRQSNKMGKQIISKMGRAYVDASENSEPKKLVSRFVRGFDSICHRHVRATRIIQWMSRVTWNQLKKQIRSSSDDKTEYAPTAEDIRMSMYMIYDFLCDGVQDSLRTICARVLENEARHETRRKALGVYGRYLMKLYEAEKKQHRDMSADGAVCCTLTDGDGVTEMTKRAIDQQWPLGTKVKIHSLEKQRILNGLEGEICQAFDVDTKRIKCRLSQNQQVELNIKIENLKLLSVDESSSENA